MTVLVLRNCVLFPGETNTLSFFVSCPFPRLFHFEYLMCFNLVFPVPWRNPLEHFTCTCVLFICYLGGLFIRHKASWPKKHSTEVECTFWKEPSPTWLPKPFVLS